MSNCSEFYTEEQINAATSAEYKGESIGTATPIDIVASVRYGMEKVKLLLCQENSAKFKAEWTDYPKTRSYYCPPGLDCPSGACMFTEDGCKSNTCYPYQGVDGEACTLEDHSGCSPGCYETFGIAKAQYERDQKDPPDKPPKYGPDVPYVEWRDGQCVLGNPMFRLWCTTPRKRQSNGACMKGMTNVVPFDFDDSTGKCHITEDYCTNGGSSDCDSRKGGMDIQFRSGDGGHCRIPPGEKFTEDFITGKTIFRGLKDTFSTNAAIEDVKGTDPRRTDPRRTDPRRTDPSSSQDKRHQTFKKTAAAIFTQLADDVLRGTSGKMPFGKNDYKNRAILVTNYFGPGINLEIADFSNREIKSKYDPTMQSQVALIPSREILGDSRKELDFKDGTLGRRIRNFVRTRVSITRMFMAGIRSNDKT